MISLNYIFSGRYENFLLTHCTYEKRFANSLLPSSSALDFIVGRNQRNLFNFFNAFEPLEFHEIFLNKKYDSTFCGTGYYALDWFFF